MTASPGDKEPSTKHEAPPRRGRVAESRSVIEDGPIFIRGFPRFDSAMLVSRERIKSRKLSDMFMNHVCYALGPMVVWNIGLQELFGREWPAEEDADLTGTREPATEG